MEILIPGLLLVALMVYASTKIKKNAAAAYEEERIEKAEYSIIKPEGMIIPVGSNTGVIFEAYSRDFGIDEAGEIRQITAEIRRHPDAEINEIKASVIDGFEILDETAGKTGVHNTVQIEFLKYERGAERHETVKLIESYGAVTELRVSALTVHDDINLSKVATMLDSFRAN